MFARKKQLRKIEDKLLRIEKEKQELLKIKEMLDDKSPKVDISDVYVWEYDHIAYIVKQYIKPIVGHALGGAGSLRKGFESTLVDIFTNNTVYKKYSTEVIKERELVKNVDGSYSNYPYAKFYHILDVDRRLLEYPDKKVPLYVLQQTYYELNNIDITKVKTKVKDK